MQIQLFGKFIILLSLLLGSFSSFSQDYEDIKKQTIELESFIDSPQESFVSNIYTFIGKDFDSLDIEILFNGPVLGSIVVQVLSEEDSITYEDIYQEFINVKQLPYYPEIRKKQSVVKELRTRPADIANWEEDKLLFLELGIEKEDLEEIHAYLVEHSSSTLSYETVLSGFKEQKAKETQLQESAQKKELMKSFEPSKIFHEPEVLAQSKLENKPVLLYFTGVNCINCRKIEETVLFDLNVSSSLLQDFIFVPIYVDIKKELSQEEEIQVMQRTEKIKTVGEKHLYYQISRFNVSSQPYFVVLNMDNEIIGTTDYETSKTVKAYQAFLNESLLQFSE